MRRKQIILLSFVFLLGMTWVEAQDVVFKQDDTPYNRSSYQGLPLTSDLGIPLDKDGNEIPEANKDDAAYSYRAPFSSEQAANNLTTSVPTTGQLRAFVIQGQSLTRSQTLMVNGSETLNSDGSVKLVEVFDENQKYRLRTARIGAMFYAVPSSLKFGDVIDVPTKDEKGIDLASPDEYWFLEPYEDVESYNSGQIQLGYYWSQHARKVFAVQTGTIQISWKKRVPTSNDDSLFTLVSGSTTRYQMDGDTDNLEFILNEDDGFFYVLNTQTYTVLGSASKVPQTVYWNDGDYNGPQIAIDRGVVGDFQFIYTDDFPETVVTGTEYNSITQQDEDVSEKTIYLDKAGGIWQIKAQHQTGRIFAEILGDPKGDGYREFLGYEIVDVQEIGVPELITVDLGEVIPSGVSDEPEGGLFPSPVNLVSSLDFTYRQVVDGTDIPLLWATHLTENTGDLEIHWMAEGVEGIRWPYQFSRYQLVWPTDYSKYSQYIRPSSNDEDAAELTSVMIPSEMVPIIEEQDYIAGGGAFVGEDTRFYTIVTEENPVHRTLLRYSSGMEVAFERVLSWRTDEIKAMQKIDSAELTHPYTILDSSFGGGIDYPRWSVLDGDFLYVNNYQLKKIMILDISDLNDIQEVYTIEDGATANDASNDGTETTLSIVNPASLVVEDLRLYFTTQNGTHDFIYSWDISNPEAPGLDFIIENGVSAGGMNGVSELVVDDANIFTVSNGDNVFRGIRASDVKTGDPLDSGSTFRLDDGATFEVEDDEGNVSTVTLNGTGMESLEVINGFAYVTDADADELYVFKITSPFGAELVRVYTSSDPGFENMDRVWGGISVTDTLLILPISDSNRVKIFDLTDPANLVLLSELVHEEDGYNGLDAPHWSVVADDVLVVLGRNSDVVTLVDLSEPSSPVLLEEIYIGDYGLETLTTIDFDGKHLILPCETTDQVAIIRWQDPRVERWSADAFEGSLAENLDVFNGELSDLTISNGGSSYFEWGSVSDWEDDLSLRPPLFVEETVNVGERIVAPSLEEGASDGEDYIAGYINEVSGTSYHPGAYVNPLNALSSFDEANLGAIIPVNAIPGDNHLEVWWMRGSNVDASAGFSTIYWPSSIGYYTLQYPEDADEIVLASGDGSGALSSLLAAGSIYYENEPGAVGYNPNEEHAIMIGGQVYALRDDLNLMDDLTVVTDGQYSSEPFVLLDYVADDGRPAIKPYKVLRENSEKGWVFNIPIEAASAQIQPLMPLPNLGIPLTEDATSLEDTWNREIAITFIESNTADNLLPTTLTMPSEHAMASGEFYVAEGSTVDTTTGFLETRGVVVSSVLDHFNVEAYIGVSELIPVSFRQYCKWRINQQVANTNEDAISYEVEDRDWGTHGSTKIMVFSKTTGEFQIFTLLDSTENRIFLRLSDGSLDGLIEDAEYAMILGDSTSLDMEGWALAKSIVPRSSRTTDNLSEFYSGYTFTDRKGDLWAYRGPHESTSGAVTGDGFSLQFHYPTQEGFAFPSTTEEIPVGTITPYLRIHNGSEYLGDPIYAEEYETGVTQAAPITYLPYWPTDAKELKFGKTLTTAYNEIDGIRGNSSAEILYQQSIANHDNNTAHNSVVLHDPTRDKRYYLGAESDGILFEIPATVEAVNYLGDYYFPQLPPHLSERFYLDPNLGEYGALVFKGEFIEHNQEDYLLPNVIGEGDLETLQNLIDADSEEDSVVTNWNNAIIGLTTDMVRFVKESGVYVASDDAEGFNYSIGYNQVAEVNDDDIAVDSYAITATGSGTGYVTVITGNGNAFTDSNGPVGMFVFKVVDTLHDGLLDVVPSDNPLSEKLTMQQSVDLSGGSISDFVFEWKIAAPVGSSYPEIANASVLADPEPIAGQSIWNHIPFPTLNDNYADVLSMDSRRVTTATLGTLQALNSLTISSWSVAEDESEFSLTFASEHALAVGDVIGFESGSEWITYVVDSVGASNLSVGISQYDSNQTGLTGFDDLQLAEISEVGVPISILHKTFTTTEDEHNFPTALWLGVELSDHLGIEVFINGERVVTAGMNEIDSSYSDSATKSAPSESEASSYDLTYFIDPSILDQGDLSDTTWTHNIVVLVHAHDSTVIDNNHRLDFALDLEEYQEVLQDNGWVSLETLRHPDGIRAILGGKADVQSLSDNYITMRYGQKDVDDVDGDGDTEEILQYSKWTYPPILAEGWIKRVLDGINPFDQRVTDLFNNAIETDASILTLAGPRWEGDVALNSDTINDFGLIEIYETVLNKGKGLSIDAGINYGPANDALLLAAGYLNDLYMMLGNEAWADALNPTIGISTADGALGDVATSSFAFQGQVATLLEEELAMLRGRDDFVSPGVEGSPVYNRLFWNYTRGIDSGEIIYALNYNIQEDQDDAVDGIIDAADAQIMYPQGHGDAYGHYLTAIKNYFKLILDEDFDWVPRAEALLILGQTVQVDYTDERKFAAAASSLAEAGSQIVDLTWRQDYESGDDVGWDHFGEDAIRENTSSGTVRYWGLDHWATRVAQGTYINWIVGNSMLEEVDSDASHEGIQIIDRQTVPELKELTYLAESVQVSMDNADAHLNPLGLTEGSIPFDIEPISSFDVNPTGNRTHFEQIYDRAVAALQNAVVAFDGAKDVTALMRSEDDSLADFQADVDRQELAYKNQLIEIYGTPYADDIGVGATYVTDYDGPDLLNYNMVDLNELTIPNWITPEEDKDYTISSIVDANQNPFGQTYQTIIDYERSDLDNIDSILNEVYLNGALDLSEDTDGDGELDIVNGEDYYTLNSHGFFDKPDDWGSRESPGEIQSAIGQIITATNDLRESLENYSALAYKFDRELELFLASVVTHDEIREINRVLNLVSYEYEVAMLYYEFVEFILKERWELTDSSKEAIKEGFPKSTIVGLAAGGDLTSGARAAMESGGFIQEASISAMEIANFALNNVAARALNQVETWVPFLDIAPKEWAETQRQAIFDLDMSLGDVQMSIFTINNKIQKLGAAKSKYKALVAKGNRIQAEREVFRKRAAAVTQGFRTRDAAFRVFRDEKLERYKSLFDLAARFTFMAAQAYDYETGLLFTDEGKEFINRIISSRALGVMENGSPQFGGSNTGDPGLSSVLAEMNADWQVLRGRLGHNNPDTEKTTVSLRTENFRILPGDDGDSEWQDVLSSSWVDDLRSDEDVMRHCLQIENGSGLPVPGLVIEFSTTITEGLNLFGQSLAGGDHAFSPTSYATKVFSVGVALEGYQGIDDPASNAATTGSSSVTDPDASFLDPSYLSSTPYVYLIPVGLDAMRSPPLGDQSVIRTWEVEDLTIPLPFNIGASDFSSKPLYQSSDSLTDDLFGLRKHQAFRAVGSTGAFPDNGRLMSSVYTNTRLMGRSVWNTQWKLVIPGRTLLNDPERGLELFIDTVTDIKLNFETLSYSGN